MERDCVCYYEDELLSVLGSGSRCGLLLAGHLWAFRRGDTDSLGYTL